MSSTEYFQSEQPQEGLQYQQEQQQESGGLPGVIVARITRHLGNFVDPNAKGWVFGADTDFKLPNIEGPLQPDVAFVSAERLPFPDRNTVPLAPDLVAEVFSKTDSQYDMADKVREYLEAGVKLVWVVRLPAKLVEVYRPGNEEKPTLFGPNDELDGGEVLPGFKLRVGEIFERLPPQALEADFKKRSRRKAETKESNF